MAAAGGVVFLFDENFPRRVVNALFQLGEQAHHVHEFLPPGTPDELVLRYAGERGWCMVTRDRNILKKAQERAVISELGMGAFFLDAGIDLLFEIAQAFIANYPEMKRLAGREERPFIYLVKRRSVLRLRPRHLGRP